MKLFNCSHCGNRVFFENDHCDVCQKLLGFSADEMKMVAFEESPESPESAQGPIQRCGAPEQALPLRACANRASGVCNWLLPHDADHQYCISCRTTHTIPALSKPQNLEYWIKLERAKRHLVFTLLELGLPVPNKVEDPANGLSFEFLEDVSPEARVLTGHDEGVITLNIAEADDARREDIRTRMHEPYRTLLGHFRHEIGHYYWDRLVRDTPWIDGFRERFGDERADYAQALQRHYASPRADWAEDCVSVYASSHPWEDWAETWAHYLHLVDGLETAAAWGLRLDHAVPTGPALQARPVDPDDEQFVATVIEQWLPVSQFINAMDRSLGSLDSYPFVIVEPVVQKLAFVHQVVHHATHGLSPMNFAVPTPANQPTAAQ
ncbi:putative zinc-binding metallopeptidase [Variovorax dokdonensis]|uniref:Zinc-binding metallopeptidase n=1 Tax=Variovorax dokdonensis TaxID=344883 RepID=A0ABT7N894_9BURK|nr:putative zinc-binding metallopeptidase [Variovorax dokdonensis]MDM0044164.1 putative zinc-binding metallopeptidase [Variovorax dokdonensis]